MSTGSENNSMFAPLGGVVVGVAVFVGVNLTIGKPIIPTVESVTDPRHDMSEPIRNAGAASDEKAEAPAAGPYQAVCQACHQAEGQGVSGAFPPLAGSEWLTGDPETPVRIVLLGLTGEIDVKGVKFNSTMPPPPGLSDEQVAEAVTYARTHFGNKASPVDVELVKSVRASLAGRTNSWSAAELTALRGAAAPAEGGEEAAPAEGGEEAAPAEGGEEAAPAEGGEEAAPAEGGEEAAPAAEAPAPGAAAAEGQ